MAENGMAGNALRLVISLSGIGAGAPFIAPFAIEWAHHLPRSELPITHRLFSSPLSSHLSSHISSHISSQRSVTAVIDTPIAIPENEDRIGSARSMRLIGPDQTSSTLSHCFLESGVKSLCFNGLAQIPGGVQTIIILFNQKAKIKNVKHEAVTRTSSLCETRAV